MSLLRWKDEYLTQVEEIDDQHRRLFDLVNGIYDMMRLGRGQEAIAEALNELYDFTRFHFGTEEKFMVDSNYNGTDPHAAEHVRLLDQVQNLRIEVRDGRIVMSMNEMYFLKDWLLVHFQGPDRGLAHHLLNAALPAIESVGL
jgi:hemerythrin